MLTTIAAHRRGGYVSADQLRSLQTQERQPVVYDAIAQLLREGRDDAEDRLTRWSLAVLLTNPGERRAMARRMARDHTPERVRRAIRRLERRGKADEA
jgi:hypothetical protein